MLCNSLVYTRMVNAETETSSFAAFELLFQFAVLATKNKTPKQQNTKTQKK